MLHGVPLIITLYQGIIKGTYVCIATQLEIALITDVYTIKPPISGLSIFTNLPLPVGSNVNNFYKDRYTLIKQSLETYIHFW